MAETKKFEELKPGESTGCRFDDLPAPMRRFLDQLSALINDRDPDCTTEHVLNAMSNALARAADAFHVIDLDGITEALKSAVDMVKAERAARAKETAS